MGVQVFDFSSAVIQAGSDSAVVQKAAYVLQEEIRRRTGLSLPVGGETERPLIFLGTYQEAVERLPEIQQALDSLESPGTEGYRVVVGMFGGQATAVAAGTNVRGVLYGAGKLLRKMIWAQEKAAFPAMAQSTAPQSGMRGHQLGYRPKTNAYDAWTPEIYDQYIRELALFGANTIELIPPRSDDEPVSRHMRYDALEMMCRVSESIHSYGLDVSVWYPNMGEDYSNPDIVAEEEAERREVFSKVPYIDHVFIPGGDPGHLEPIPLFQWSKRVKELLGEHHPKAKLWLSPQTGTTTDEWVETFYQQLEPEPEWLDGVVFAPWERDSAELLRQRTPKRYPIRNYPDITHSLQCQYPVPDWDLAMAMTLGRECINPRPEDEKRIHNIYRKYFIGSVGYSEGVNDDVNKFIWLDQDWCADTLPIETLRDYARLFIDCNMADDLAQGFISLERNLRGPLRENDNVDICLAQWQAMEREIERKGGFGKQNYRFEMGLLRAYFDAYEKRRYSYETELEAQARQILADCRRIGAEKSILDALAVLDKARSSPVYPQWKDRVEQLADLLYEHIGSQLTVTKHGAQAWGRGGFVECVDIPLNNARFLRKELKKILEDTQDENEKCSSLEKLLHREDPGPGGYYDNMGTLSSLKRIRGWGNYHQDPGYLETPLPGYVLLPPHGQQDLYCVPLSWQLNARTLYGTPMAVEYDNLDPDAEYIVRVTYPGSFNRHIRLTAGDGICIHGDLEVGRGFVTREFPLPPEAYRDGHLELTFTVPEGERGASVSEIWICKRGSYDLE